MAVKQTCLRLYKNNCVRTNRSGLFIIFYANSENKKRKSCKFLNSHNVCLLRRKELPLISWECLFNEEFAPGNLFGLNIAYIIKEISNLEVFGSKLAWPIHQNCFEVLDDFKRQQIICHLHFAHCLRYFPGFKIP